MSPYYRTLVEAAQKANLQMHTEGWYDDLRRTDVVKHYFYLQTGTGELNLIATAKEHIGYDYEFSLECSKAIRSINEFMTWV